MANTLQNIFVLILAVGTLALGYFMFFAPDSTALNSVRASIDDTLLLKTQIFMQRRAQLEAVSLPVAMFSDARFTSLIVYTTPVTAQELAKTNLFDEPINADVVSVVAETDTDTTP